MHAQQKPLPSGFWEHVALSMAISTILLIAAIWLLLSITRLHQLDLIKSLRENADPPTAVTVRQLRSISMRSWSRHLGIGLVAAALQWLVIVGLCSLLSGLDPPGRLAMLAVSLPVLALPVLEIALPLWALSRFAMRDAGRLAGAPTWRQFYFYCRLYRRWISLLAPFSIILISVLWANSTPESSPMPLSYALGVGLLLTPLHTIARWRLSTFRNRDLVIYEYLGDLTTRREVLGDSLDPHRGWRTRINSIARRCARVAQWLEAGDLGPRHPMARVYDGARRRLDEILSAPDVLDSRPSNDVTKVKVALEALLVGPAGIVSYHQVAAALGVDLSNVDTPVESAPPGPTQRFAAGLTRSAGHLEHATNRLIAWGASIATIYLLARHGDDVQGWLDDLKSLR